MIKKITFLCTFLCITIIGFSQEYVVEYSVSEYEPLVGANLIDESTPIVVGPGDERYQPIPIGFDFNYNGNSFNSLQVGENGYVIFSLDGVFKSFINIFECPQTNLQGDPALSPIYYEVSGEVGEQIFKLEFVNSGFSNDDEQEDYINYQLWIYENCNVFEIHMGEVSIDPEETDLFYNNTPAPFMGYGNNFPYFFYVLGGNPMEPILQNDPLISLNAVPDSSMVYTFRNCFVNLEEQEESTFSIYPNPASDLVTIKFSDINETSELRILNLNGQTVYMEKLPSTNTYSLNTNFLTQGIYIVTIESEKGTYSTKLVMQ